MMGVCVLSRAVVLLCVSRLTWRPGMWSTTASISLTSPPWWTSRKTTSSGFWVKQRLWVLELSTSLSLSISLCLSLSLSSCDDVVLWNLVCVCVQWSNSHPNPIKCYSHRRASSPYPYTSSLSLSLPLSPCIVESVELCRPFLGRAQRRCCPHPHIFTFVLIALANVSVNWYS